MTIPGSTERMNAGAPVGGPGSYSSHKLPELPLFFTFPARISHFEFMP